MRRILIGLALLSLAVSPLPAAAQDDGCPELAEDTASQLVGEYLASGQWDLAYNVLHPEAQIRVPRQVFAAARQANAMAAPVLDVEVFPGRRSVTWNWGVTGVRFTNVAEVPVRVSRGSMIVGAVPSIEVISLVLVGDCWRWLPPTLP